MATTKINGMIDIVFKSILYGNNIELTKWFTKRLFGREFKKIDVKNSEQRAHNIKSKIRHVDISLELDDDIICDIELNREYYDYLHARNFGYMANMYVDYVKKSKNYDVKHMYYLIDITVGLEKENKEQEKYRFYMQDEKGHRYLQNFVICENNVDKIMSHWYDRDELVDKYAHIIMLSLTIEELEELIEYKGLSENTRNHIKEYRKELNKMKKTDWWEPLFTPEEEEIVIRNTEKSIARREGKAEGIAEGKAKGIIEGKAETIKNMAKENVKPDLIAKYVGLPLSKVNQILSSIVL